MNWEALGAVGEIIGAIGVVSSLVYLAIQIRQNSHQVADNTKLARLAARDATTQSFSRYRHLIANSPELAEIYLRGCADYRGLPIADRLRFGAVLQEFFFAYDLLYERVADGRYEAGMFERQVPSVLALLSQPGVRDWWGRNKQIFRLAFVEFVERALADAANDKSPAT